MSERLFEQYKVALRLGHMAVLAGELEKALAAYDAASQLVPDRALPLASRGTVLHRLDRWQEAEAAFEQALQLAPDDEASLRARGTARAERGLRSVAATDFERLALVLDVAGRSAAAAEAARRAVDLEPTAARQALAQRLGASAARLSDARLSNASLSDQQGATEAPTPKTTPDPAANLAPAGPIAASAAGDAAPTTPPTTPPITPPPAPRVRPPITDAVASFDALNELRAEINAADTAPRGRGWRNVLRGGAPAGAPNGAPGEAPDGAWTETASPLADDAADVAEVEAGPDAGDDVAAAIDDPGPGTWPGIDLPSPPPAPIDGPPPEPEDLLAEAATALDDGEMEAARDLMLTAVRVHRDAGRVDAALEICLNLLSIAPGDPKVHLAIANLQLDRGWTGIATEKIDLLVRLTSLTGDTQAEADVHGLASERLRDDPAAAMASR